MAGNQDFTDTPYDYSADEMDAEVDSDQEQDLDKMLHSWLGELETVTQNLDSDLIQIKPDVPLAPAPPKDNLDLFQLSYSNLEETQDIDLDALLGDLCEMEQSLQMDMDKQFSDVPTNTKTNTQTTDMLSINFTIPSIDSEVTDEISNFPPPPPPDSGGFNEKVIEDLPPPPPPADMSLEELPTVEFTQHTPVEITTEPASPRQIETTVRSPVEDIPKTKMNGRVPPGHLNLNIDMNNSQQSLSSISTSPSFSPPPANISKSVRVKLKDLELDLHNDETLTEEEKVARIKAEKVRIALEKLKAARVKKLIIKVHTDDGSSKTVFVDETMNTRNIVHMMIEKNHFEGGPNWALVEQMPDLYMERVLEDGENVVTDVLLNWSRETNNRILFSERREKYALFKNPQHYLLSLNTSQFATEFAEKSKKTLVDEFFVGSGTRVPELEGPLFLKSEGKKSWKKHYFVLRASGLYYSPKGKSKVSKDIVCLVQFEHIEVYNGVGWKKKYKAPSDFCLALKHPQIQQKSKYIKYICAEDYRTCQRWITGIRIAKHGKGLLKNFEESQREMYKFIKNQDTASEASLGDTSSLSSDQSVATVSSQGSASSGGSGIQSRHANRRSHMGDVFSQAWRKGKEVEETRRLSRGSMSMSMEDDTGPLRPPLVTPTMTRATETTFDYDVQQQLQQLERDMELDLNLQDLPPPANVSSTQPNVAIPNSPTDKAGHKKPPAAPRRMDSTRLSTSSNRSKSFSEGRRSSEIKRVQFKEATEEITTPPMARPVHQRAASEIESRSLTNHAPSQRSSLKMSRSSTNQSLTSPCRRRPSLPLANTVYTPPWLQPSIVADSITNNSSNSHSDNIRKEVPVQKPTVPSPIQTNRLNQANIHASESTSSKVSPAMPFVQSLKHPSPPTPTKISTTNPKSPVFPPANIPFAHQKLNSKPQSAHKVIYDVPPPKPAFVYQTYRDPEPPPSPPLEIPESVYLPSSSSISQPSPRPLTPPFPVDPSPSSSPPTPPFPVDDLPPPPASLLHSVSQENLFDSTTVLPPPPIETDTYKFSFANEMKPTVINTTSKPPPVVSPKPNKNNKTMQNGIIPPSPNALPVSPKPPRTKPPVSAPPTQPKPSPAKKQGPPSPPKPTPVLQPQSKPPPPVTSPKPQKVGSLRINNAAFLEQLNNSLHGTENKQEVPTNIIPPSTPNKPFVATRKVRPLPPRRSESTHLSTIGTTKIPPSPPQRLK